MSSTTVKEGVLLKKGEYISTWRQRYFVLASDGTFRGYKSKPAKPSDAPINFFDIINSSIKPDDTSSKKGKWGFNIMFRQVNRVIERSFHVEKISERDEWIQAYTDVKAAALGAQAPGSGGGGGDAAAAAPRSADADFRRSRAMTWVDGVKKDIEMVLADFEMLKVLGKGTFGKVMLTKHKSSGDIFAMKVLKKSMVLEKDELAHTMAENAVLAKCRHPFLTELRYAFMTEDLLCFVLEYVNGGELFFHLSKERRFSEERTRFYVAEISSAIAYLHAEGIIYRDLKLENLMLDREGHIKITDFGLCKESIGYGDVTTTFCGTPEYLAPEVIEDSDYGRSVDWWGVGVVMHEMISGQLPFRSRDHEELFGLILTQPLSERLLSGFSPDARDCVVRLLNKDPDARLCSGPTGGQEIKDHPFFRDIDFAKLDARAIKPPFVPKVKSDTDTGNFDTFFTAEAAVITPPDGGGAPIDKTGAFKDFQTVTE